VKSLLLIARSEAPAIDIDFIYQTPTAAFNWTGVCTVGGDWNSARAGVQWLRNLGQPAVGSVGLLWLLRRVERLNMTRG